MANLSLQFSFSVLAVLILLELSFCHLAMATYYSGVATNQNGDIVPNSCFGNHDQGIFGARLRAGIYDNACNRYYKVKCVGDSSCNGVTMEVKIVDICHNCSTTFVLPYEAFAKIANPSSSQINIVYEYQFWIVMIVCRNRWNASFLYK